jgi:uncharacterized coiled-coil protein SlyX
MSWLQAKVAAQARALDALHTRVVNQRFQLRTLNELGRGLSKEEFLKARDAIENDQTRERVGDPA